MDFPIQIILLDMKRTAWVLDYETIVNCFMVVFESLQNQCAYQFVCWEYHNDIASLLDFLLYQKAEGHIHVSYNGLDFDNQLTEYLLTNEKRLRKMSGAAVAAEMYAYAQRIIDLKKRGEFMPVSEWNLRIESIDLFKLNHYDAKKVSLKWVQFGLDWHNMQEMPHPHTDPVPSVASMQKILSYCRNDVASTKQIVLHKDSKGKQPIMEAIELRRELSETYPIRLQNASEPRISKEMFLHFLSEKLGMDKKVLAKQRTYRQEVKLADVILPTIHFKTAEFQNVLDWFKSGSIDTKVLEGDTSDEKSKGPKYRMTHKGVPTDYGLGGLHGCTAPGIYEKKPGWKIMSADVTSFYPNLSIKNKWAPAHINKEAFCELYEWVFQQRKKYPKGSSLNYVMKIILNATYGLSKNLHSFLYDPFFTFQITVNGQLLLSMLYEEISLRIPESIPLMQNTDGFEMMIPESAEALYYEICHDWEHKTQLALEFVEYDKMIIRDVNNYIAVYEGSKTKCKGFFEFEDLPFHKNKSMLVVPKAVYAYFIHGIDPEVTLQNNQNIFDYCAGVKASHGWKFVAFNVDESGVGSQTELSKVIRYYVSTQGDKLYKNHSDGRSQQLEADSPYQHVYNQHRPLPWQQYGVDPNYYLDQIWKEIKNVTEPDVTKKKKSTKMNTISQLQLAFSA